MKQALSLGRDAACDFIAERRKILTWEKKMLVRFRNDGLNTLPSAVNYFHDTSTTLDPNTHPLRDAPPLPNSLLTSEPYFALEYIHGQILENCVKRPDFVEALESKLLHLAREILTIFIRIHRPFEINGRDACFIYQDLKPTNILVSDEDYFTLIDFGGVTLWLGGQTTEPTAGCMTRGYAGPEASRGRESRIDPRFDLYSLGATLWHVVTQIDPRDLPGEFPELSGSALDNCNISRDFAAFIKRAIARNPDERYVNAAEMRKKAIQLLQKHTH